MKQQLTLTVCISLIVTLFFAFRAEAQEASASAVSEAQWKKVDDHNMSDIQMLVSLDRVQQAVKNINSTNCADKAHTISGVPAAYFNEWVKVGVPEVALKKALAYEMNDPHADSKDKAVTNKEWLTIIDYTVPSSQERMFVINLETGEVIKSLVAHGKGSDDGHGEAVKFSNRDASLQTTPGFLKIGDHFTSHKDGPAFILKGLEDRNSAAEKRGIIMHGAPYVNADIVKSLGRVGRSWGCPAVSPEMLKLLYSKKISGSLLYGYTAEDAKVDAK